MEEMKAAARAQGLWNLWVSPDLAAHIRPALPESLEGEDKLLLGAGLSNLVRHLCVIACALVCGDFALAAAHCCRGCPHRMLCYAEFTRPVQLPLHARHVVLCLRPRLEAVPSS